MSTYLAIIGLLTLPNGQYVAPCRAIGCEQYAQELASAIDDAAEVYDIPAAYLLAVAFRESSAMGRSGADGLSTGPWGWHVRSRLWREVWPVCGVTQLEHQAAITARELAALAVECGSLEHALGAWRTGRCESETGNRYARRVVALAGRIGGT